jgi:hypothetical protein
VKKKSYFIDTHDKCYEIDGINEAKQGMQGQEAYSSLNFSGSLGKNHQVKFDDGL